MLEGLQAISSAAFGAVSADVGTYAKRINDYGPPLASPVQDIVDELARAYPTKQAFAQEAGKILQKLDEAKKAEFSAAAEAKHATLPDAPAPQPQRATRNATAGNSRQDRAPGQGASLRDVGNAAGAQELPPELAALKNERDAASNATEAAGRDLEDTKLGFENAQRDYSYATQDAREKDGTTRSREVEFERAGEEQSGWERQVQDFRNQLDVLWNKVRDAWDLARFYRQKFELDLRSAIQKMSVEIYCEQRNANNDILVSWQASCVKFGACIADSQVGKGMNATFQKHDYLRIGDPIRDQSPEYFKMAEGQQSDAEAQEEKLAKMIADDYPAEKVAKAKQKLSEAKAELATAEATEEAKRSGMQAMNEAYNLQRTKYGDAKDQTQGIQRRLEEAAQTRNA